jgi:uncharacterized protein YuzB (UPF0349 family)
MTTYTLDGIRGLDLSITVEPSMQGMRGYGIAFDDDADIVAETESRQYIGYCIADVLASIAGDLTNGDDNMRDASDIFEAIGAAGIECHCD